MKALILTSILLLTGCSTTQVAVEKPIFPEPPSVLMAQPDKLKELQEGAQLSDVAETIIYNYGLYHKLSEQMKSLQSWVLQQRELYNK